MNKPAKIPWNRLTAEGAAIVLSILLAFAIDAKWEDYLARVEEHSFLSSIKSEIDANLAKIDKQLSYRNDMNTVIKSLFDASDGILDLSPTVLDSHIHEVSFWSRSGFNTGTIDSLSQGGNLSIVAATELRSKLTDLQSLYRWVDEMERQEELFTRHYFTPFLMKNAFLPQIANSGSRAFEGVIVPSTSDYAKGKGADHSYLLKNGEFLGLLVREKWNHQDTIYNMIYLRDQMLEIKSLIDERLGD